MARKKKKSAMGIFFAFFLKAIVIILGLVILAMSAFLVRTVILAKDSESQSEADENAFEEDQEDELLTAEEIKDDSLLFDESEEGAVGGEEVSTSNEIAKDASIVVLNGTQTAGLAAAWKDKLAEQGYTNIQTGNYYGGDLATSRIVLVQDGLSGSSLQAYVANATVENGSADSISCDVSPEGVVCYVIIGGSDNILAQ